MMTRHTGVGVWGWFWMTSTMALLWAGIIVLGIVAFRAWSRRPATTDPNGRQNAERILAERFARGEIEEAEYVQRMAALREHGGRQ